MSMYLEWFLLVAVLILALRVWWLGEEMRDMREDVLDVKDACGENTKWRYGQFDQSYLLDFAKGRVDSLARALGYEWKRTEAKEGWERKNPFYGSPFFKCDPFAGIDLSGHYVAPKPPTNRPTKKPTTRTAAKRGPQRRATH